MPAMAMAMMMISCVCVMACGLCGQEETEKANGRFERMKCVRRGLSPSTADDRTLTGLTDGSGTKIWRPCRST